MKIKEVKFNNFRAYKDERFVIPDNRNIILIYARNGFGKTSFFDGIEWGLTGELKRYSEKVKERTEYPILRNSFSSINSNDGIEILFDTDERIKRFIKEDEKSDYDIGQLIYNGGNIENLNNILINETFVNDVDFSKSFAFTQFLSQELINDFVRNTKDNDRYKKVVDLFGLTAYKDYDKHIESILLFLKKEIDRINNSEILGLQHTIAIEKGKSKIINIEPLVKTEELERIYGEKVDLHNLTIIKKEFEKSKDKVLKEKIQFDSSITQLTYLTNNFREKEIKIIEDRNLKQEIEEYRKFIEKNSKKLYFEKIDKHIGNKKLYSERKEQIEEITKEINEIKIVLNSHGFFDKNKNGEDLFSLLADYKKEYKDMVFQYFESKKRQTDEENILNRLESDLKRISGLKNQLYLIAKKFLEDSKNENLTECPVCENDFNRDGTLLKLNKKLDLNIDNEFQAINKSIQQTKVSLINNKKDIESKKQNLLNICEKNQAQYREKYQNLLLEQKENNSLLESNNIVIESLRNLDVELEKYKEYRESYFQEIKKSKFYIEDMSENFHKENILKKEDKQKSIYNEIEKYQRLKILYKINQFKDIENILNEKNIQKEKNLYKIETLNKAIVLSTELIHFEKNNKQQENIKILEKQLKSFEDEIKILENIQDDYKNFKDAVKKTIDNETKRMLSDYGEVIEKIYHYLNPSIYMNNLSIKETRNNANRLVFEVSSESGKKHSPSYIFSSAQNNVLALSIFLSFAVKQQWSKLDAIFLDDPIQNMDDINIHSFVDLIRSIEKKTDKQFFISTHDERIYNFMLNKFGKDNVHSFKLKDYGKLEKTL